MLMASCRICRFWFIHCSNWNKLEYFDSSKELFLSSYINWRRFPLPGFQSSCQNLFVFHSFCRNSSVQKNGFWIFKEDFMAKSWGTSSISQSPGSSEVQGSIRGGLLSHLGDWKGEYRSWCRAQNWLFHKSFCQNFQKVSI